MKKILLFLLCIATVSTAQIRQGFRIIAPDSTIEMRRKGDTTRVNIVRKVTLKKPVITVTMPDSDATLASLESENRWIARQSYAGIFNLETHGADLVPNFTAGLPGWSGANWSYQATGKAVHAVGSTAPLVSTIAVRPGRVYRVSWTVTGATAGTISAGFGGWSSSPVFPFGGYSGWGDHLITKTADPLIFYPSVDFDGAISSVALREVPSIASVDTLNQGLYIFTDAANDQRILMTKSLWVGSFHPKPISFNHTNETPGRGVYIDEYANLKVRSNDVTHNFAVGGNSLLDLGVSTGAILEIKGAANDSYVFGYDGTGGYLAPVNAKPFRIYGATSGFIEVSTLGSLYLKRASSSGSIFTLEGTSGDIYYLGYDNTGGYLAMGNAKPFTIYGGTSGTFSLSAASEATLTGSLTSSSFIQATEFRTGGTSIYSLAHTWSQDQAFGGDIKIVRGSGTPWLNIINSNTSGAVVLSMAEADNGTTPFYIQRNGSASSGAGRVDFYNSAGVRFTTAGASHPVEFYLNGAIRFTFGSDGFLQIPAMTASQIVETDGSSVLVTAVKRTGYNLALGNSAGTVSEGNHAHNFITLGGSSPAISGTLMWDGTHFQGYNGTSWVQLDN